MNYIDLFSGIGGFALGAYWADMHFENHYFSEIEPYCVELYQKRFPDAIPLGDIKEIDCEKLMADTGSIRGETGLPGQDSREEGDARESNNASNAWIITGGFPCTDISIAGKGAGIRGQRSGLWFEMWRIIRDLRPRFAIMENVGAITFRGLTDVLGSLAEIGYDAEWQDIRAEDVGAPHRRERIWIVTYPHEQGESGRAEHAGERQRELVSDTHRKHDDNAGHGAGEIFRERSEETEILRGIPNAPRPISESGTGRRGIREGDTQLNGKNWATEPDVGRLAHGVPSRVHRLRGLGNAIVPQIAELLWRQIKDICH